MRVSLVLLLLFSGVAFGDEIPDVGRLYSPSVTESYYIKLDEAPPYIWDKEESYAGEDFCALHESVMNDTKAALLGYLSGLEGFSFTQDLSNYSPCQPDLFPSGAYGTRVHLKARGCELFNEDGSCADWRYSVTGGDLHILMTPVKICPSAEPYDDHTVPVETASGVMCAKPLNCVSPFKPEITRDSDGYISKTECTLYCPADKPFDAALGICKPPARQSENLECPEKAFNPIITKTGEKVETINDGFNLPGEFPLSLGLRYGSQSINEIEFSVNAKNVDQESASNFYRYVQPSNYEGPQFNGFLAANDFEIGMPVGDKQWTTSFDWSLFVKDNGAIVIKNGNNNVREFMGAGYSVGKEKVTNHGDGWRLIANDGLRYIFNAQGKVTRVDHISGESHAYEYEGGRVSAIHHSSYGSLVFGYSGNLLTSVTLPDSSVYTYVYDALNNLVEIVNPTGDSKIFHYEDARHPYALTGITDERGVRYATWEYDPAGRAISSSHANGADSGSVSYQNGSVTTTDVLGNETTLTYNGYNRLVRADGITCDSNGEPGSVRYSYDSLGKVTKKTFQDNDSESYSYNSQGFVQVLTRFSSESQKELTSYASYNSDLTLNYTTNYYSGSKWNRTYYKYYPEFLVKSVEENHSVGRKTSYEYTASKQLSKIDGPRTDVQDVTTFTYDASGRLATSTNALGHVVTYLDYDDAGRILTAEDANGVQTHYSYDSLGRLTQISVENSVTQISYDEIGQVTAVSDGVSSFSYVYDAARRLIEIRDGEGNSILFDHDLAGNVLSREVQGSSQQITSKQSFLYDKVGRLVKRISSSNSSWQFAYDKDDNLVKKTDPAGNDLLSVFDGFNRAVADTDQIGAQKTVAYTDNHQIKSVTDALGHKTQYKYNGFGDLVSEISPNRGTTTYQYDLAGNLTRKQDANGIVATYLYDALNRLTDVTYPAYPSQNIHYEYDDTTNGNKGIGRVTGMIFAGGERHYVYDGLGRIIQDTQRVDGQDYTVGYQYNAQSQLVRVDLPSGARVHYQYDSVGKLASQQFQESPTSNLTTVVGQIEFLPFGPISSVTYGNGIAQTNSYDLDYRLIGQHSTVWNADYDYDLNGNITEISHDPAGLDSLLFGYDLINRLVNAEGEDHREYGYDNVGNRQRLTNDGAVTQYSYSPSNQHLIQRDQESFNYDAAGNLISNDRFTFEYTVDGHLGKVKDATTGDLVAQYHYNPTRQRIRKTVFDASQSAETTHYVYSLDGSLLGEYSDSGIAQREYLRLNGQPLAVHTARPPLLVDKAFFYYHNDHLGVPKVLTDELGTPVWKASHTPFGEAKIDVDVVKNNVRFPGQYYDEETELHYNWNRYYDPALGRYISSDPIGLGGGINTYSYALSNPVNYMDLNGLNSTSMQLTSGYVLSQAGASLGSSGPAAAVVGSGLIGYGIGTLVNDGFTSLNGGVPLGGQMYDWVHSNSSHRPADMTRLEERQYDRHCSGPEDPCLAIKAAAQQHLINARLKMNNMLNDKGGLYGTIGWTTHENDLKGRLANIAAMISLGKKMGCDMREEALALSALSVPSSPL